MLGARRAASASACRFGLGSRRLTGRSAFDRLLREGERRSLSGYAFYLVRRDDDGPPRLGILVSRRHSAKATERNSLKRCVREAFRLEQECLGPLDLLVRPPYGARAGAAMLARLRELLARLDR